VPVDPEIREIAADLLPAERVDAAVASVVPGWSLTSTSGGPIRIGGPALLLDGEPWPRNVRGVPLTFLAAIPLGELPDATVTGLDPDWPHENETLRVFADLVASPHEPCAALVLPARADARLTETAPPPLPDPWPADPRNAGSEYDQDDLRPEDRVRELPIAPSRARPDLSVDPLAFWDPDGTAPDPDARALRSFAEEVSGWMPSGPQPAGGTRILGAPWGVQDDPRLEADVVLDDRALPPSEYVVLLGIHDGYSRVEILDGGAYAVCVPRSALGTTYGPAFCSVQSC
jgi:hypothetical protein